MRLLLDTHVVLWSLAQPERISQRARECMIAAESALFASVVVAWETAIKQSLGRIELAPDWLAQIEARYADWRIELLGIAHAHCVRVGMLPFHHRDPFDRMLIAQAQEEHLSIVSADPAFDAYGIERIW
ncbi:type II toxin-antitoxin system VapC family toxin [Vulcaniibacterium gelatinicum]|uniref:type II toxin-antitoxin system VapC family toxin n=1 Tax=Vulcaniibacterium gelatinicum TaxID=2598725 RepID=UPI0011CC4F79|nr:type II toxin-antitoxin system VapC family toxin [Vulcaniibacterium gelatinicum]